MLFFVLAILAAVVLGVALLVQINTAPPLLRAAKNVRPAKAAPAKRHTALVFGTATGAASATAAKLVDRGYSVVLSDANSTYDKTFAAIPTEHRMWMKRDGGVVDPTLRRAHAHFRQPVTLLVVLDPELTANPDAIVAHTSVFDKYMAGCNVMYEQPNHGEIVLAPMRKGRIVSNHGVHAAAEIADDAHDHVSVYTITDPMTDSGGFENWRPELSGQLHREPLAHDDVATAVVSKSSLVRSARARAPGPAKVGVDSIAVYANSKTGMVNAQRIAVALGTTLEQHNVEVIPTTELRVARSAKAVLILADDKQEVDYTEIGRNNLDQSTCDKLVAVITNTDSGVHSHVVWPTPCAHGTTAPLMPALAATKPIHAKTTSKPLSTKDVLHATNHFVTALAVVR